MTRRHTTHMFLLICSLIFYVIFGAYVAWFMHPDPNPFGRHSLTSEEGDTR